MKRLYTILISLFATGITFGQSVTGVYVPQYMQGGSSTQKVPFVCQLKISGLLANTTYRYYNRMVSSADTATTSTANGFGAHTIVKQTLPFLRVTTANPSLGNANHYGKFTTDNTGSYTGWFIAESIVVPEFDPGSTVYVRIVINDGSADGSPTVGAVSKRLCAANSPITVVTFGASTLANSCTGIYSTPATNGVAGNFVMLYNNTAGTGRPVAGAVVESDGATNTTGFVDFYKNNVDAKNGAWGTIIPNSINLPGGIQKIVQYSLATGNKVSNHSSATGEWAKAGGGTVSTASPTGAETFAIDGAVVSFPPMSSQTITFNSLPVKTYGDAEFLAGATVNSTLPVIYSSNNTAVADTVRINGVLHITIKGAGSADITATQPGDDVYGAAMPVTRTLTVDKATLTITAQDKSWLAGTPLPELTVTYTGFKYNDDKTVLNPQPTVTTTATNPPTQPTYPITPDGAGSPNYNFVYVPGTLTIVANKQPQQINFSAIPGKTYGDLFDPGAIATSGLTVTYTSSDPAVAQVVNNGTMVQIVGVGTATITASQGGDATYEAATNVTATVTANKALLTITAQDKKRLYGQNNPTFTVVYSGFVNGDDQNDLLTQPVATCTATVNTNAGAYPITVTGAASDNYDFKYVNGTLTIDALPAQVITFSAIPVKKYGDAEFWAGAKASSGLKVSYTSSNPNVATIVKDTIIQIVGAGTAVITASQAGNSMFGAAQDVTQSLTVQKAALTIRADNQARNEGQPNPPLTVTYTGFVNNEDSSRLTTLPTVTTAANTASFAGTYRINVQGATSPNYAINQQNGILTILPAQGDGQDNLNAYVTGGGQLQVNVYAVNTVKVSVQLFDLNGSRVANSTVTLVKGFNAFRLPIGNLSPGIYNIRVGGGDVLLKTKVVIQ